MANEIGVQAAQTGLTAYSLVRNRTNQPWNTSGAGAFENYSAANYGSYAGISLTEQGNSAYYAGNFPSAIPAGTYNVVAKNQVGGSPAEADPTLGEGNIEWNGTAVAPLSDAATSGQVGQIGPVRVARGVMVQNFKIYFKSSADHVTPLTSGVVSGQICRDAGTFGPLQSGAFTEEGNGFYRLQALTSGDLLCDTCSILFNAVGISGGTADPLPMTIVTQKVSGQ